MIGWNTNKASDGDNTEGKVAFPTDFFRNTAINKQINNKKEDDDDVILLGSNGGPDHEEFVRSGMGSIPEENMDGENSTIPSSKGEYGFKNRKRKNEGYKSVNPLHQSNSTFDGENYGQQRKNFKEGSSFRVSLFSSTSSKRPQVKSYSSSLSSYFLPNNNKNNNENNNNNKIIDLISSSSSSLTREEQLVEPKSKLPPSFPTQMMMTDIPSSSRINIPSPTPLPPPALHIALANGATREEIESIVQKTSSSSSSMMIEETMETTNRTNLPPLSKQLDLQGRNALHIAVRNNVQSDIISYLLEVDPALAKTFDNALNVPLHLACVFGCSFDSVKCLIRSYRRGLSVCNIHGKTPLDIAQWSDFYDDDEIDYLLLAAYCDVENKFVVRC